VGQKGTVRAGYFTFNIITLFIFVTLRGSLITYDLFSKSFTLSAWCLILNLANYRFILLSYLLSWWYSISSLLWDVTQRGLVVIYRRFGRSYRFYIPDSSSIRLQVIYRCLETNCLSHLAADCSKKSVNNCQSILRNIAEDLRCHLHGDGILTSCSVHSP
jgi:hypothetical protein